jgi:hypothetical protein
VISKLKVSLHCQKLIYIILIFPFDDPELLKHPQVYALADEFLMDDLKILAIKNFQLMLHKLWIRDTFVDCIEEIYTTIYRNNDQMRGTVVQTAHDHLKILWEQNRFQDLVRANGDFAVDLMGKLSADIRPRGQSQGPVPGAKGFSGRRVRW